MDNKDFWTSISAIIRNGFDGEGLKKLEEYAKQFINGQLLFKRYTENEQFGCAVGGTLHVIAYSSNLFNPSLSNPFRIIADIEAQKSLLSIIFHHTKCL